MLFLNHDLAFQIEKDLRKGNRQLIESWNALDSEVSVQALEVADGLAIYGGDGCPVNEAVGLGMSSAVDETTLREIEKFYESYGHSTVIRVCLQTALLDWRLRFAKERGASIATIETEPDSDSQRNVERMGFRLAYAAVQMTRP